MGDDVEKTADEPTPVPMPRRLTEYDLRTVESVTQDFADGIVWHPGGTYVEGGQPPEIRPLRMVVAVIEGGDVHLRLILPAVGGGSSVTMGHAIIAQAVLADVLAAMQAAPPVAREGTDETRAESAAAGA